MWGWAVVLFVFAAPFVPFVKPRIPRDGSSSVQCQRLGFSFLRSPIFLIFQAGNILQSLGYFVPSIYLATYARSVLEQKSLGSTAPVLCLNAGMMLGFLGIGLLIDRWHVASCMLLSTVGATVSVFVIWGVSISLPPLLIFAIVYGAFAGSTPAAWSGIVKLMRKTDESVPAGFVLGLFAAGRGIGAVACGPISEALISASESFALSESSAMAYSTKFGVLIIFTGVTSIFGALGFGAKKMGFIP
jgi:predicted MFS family arabinose efflux permease